MKFVLGQARLLNCMHMELLVHFVFTSWYNRSLLAIVCLLQNSIFSSKPNRGRPGFDVGGKAV